MHMLGGGHMACLSMLRQNSICAMFGGIITQKSSASMLGVWKHLVNLH